MHKQKKNLARWAVGLLIAAPLPAQAQGDVTTKSTAYCLSSAAMAPTAAKRAPALKWMNCRKPMRCSPTMG